jgi:hypothetical protein
MRRTRRKGRHDRDAAVFGHQQQERRGPASTWLDRSSSGGLSAIPSDIIWTLCKSSSFANDVLRPRLVCGFIVPAT